MVRRSERPSLLPTREERAPLREAGTVVAPDSAPSGAAFELVSGEPERAEVRAGSADDALFEGDARYEEGPLLGSGGMGAVHLRRDRRIGRHVAMKTLHADVSSPEAQPRFLREARVQGQLEHPAIPPVYEIGKDEKGLWFTMKRLRGQTLSRILHGLAKGDAEIAARYSRRRLLAAFLTVCDALDYAHSRGVLHRDLKPSNIMLGEFGEVWVLDWGIARLMEDVPGVEEGRDGGPPGASTEVEPRIAGASLTRAGNLVGTLHYMSPEQLRGDRLDARSDVYALGVVLYEILTYRHFREESDYMRVLSSIADGIVARPTTIDRTVDPMLDEICARATAIEPAERTPSARALREAVEAFLDGEQDAEMRHKAASRAVEGARASLEAAKRAGGAELATARSRAMHDALRALSIEPGNADAQALLVDLVEQVGDEPPPGAEAEVARARARTRRQGADVAIWGLLSWLLAIPFAVWAGVIDWPLFIGLVGLDLAAVAFAAIRRRAGDTTSGDVIALAVIVGAANALSSAYLGPFVLVPTGIATCSMFFAMHVSRSERVAVTTIMVLSGLLPFVVESAGLVPPAYAFEHGRLVLFPRLLELSPAPTFLGLAWMTLTYALFVALITGRMRDRLDEAERRLHHSAWHLRELFPAAERAAARAR